MANNAKSQSTMLFSGLIWRKALKVTRVQPSCSWKKATRVGLGEEQEGGFSALLPPQIQSVPSDALFANLNLDLLSDEDKIELARLGQIIDLGGDFTALSERDFELAKQIANKGRGKDVTPHK
jgi:hypothetical protein